MLGRCGWHVAQTVDRQTRTIPIPPELVRLLRAHIRRYGTTPDGQVFRTTPGGIIQDSAYSAVWAEARKNAFTEVQYRSPLGRRPCDLRHAAVSLWLNSGVPATEVGSAYVGSNPTPATTCGDAPLAANSRASGDGVPLSASACV